MTYALQTKNELSRKELGDSCCQAAELTAFIRLSGNVQISGKRLTLNVVTSNPAVARRIFQLFKQIFNLNSELLVRKKIRLRKNNIYLIRISEPGGVRQVLTRLGLMREGALVQELNEQIRRKKCCRRAYLRGAFLAAGSVSNPENSYHLEIYTDYQHQAEELVEMMKTFGAHAKVTTRKNGFLAYLKDSEQIVAFLNVIGAHSALLNFENVRILKDIRNRINRLINFETANVNKTVEAAVKQAESIRAISDTIGLDSLDPPLRQLAMLRIEHPEASLQELGEMLDPPLGKSGVNHRMRKIEKMAQNLGKKR
ncbi:DNA-binding protein WhiA [Dethiobacter alkaliphilus]|uniref:DNA-binding protein WhiA n=1 Tax=Dethiobacter alkaliphilus TaxID=427926 RepID=UPI00222798C6|nr:DNA-binding protein WhiA [Dethiobacter alkaliphilus]MCW3488613.1 DNA-binding protein WhiA [Dethiobacter alkaliphilus]